MCFSATASFISAFILLIIGIASIKINTRTKYKLFSSIPLIFSLQQFSEGILWLTLPNNSYPVLQTIVTYIFLISALVIWPVFISTSLLLIEKHQNRKKLLKFFLLVGSVFALYFLYVLLTNSITASLINDHLIYHIPMLSDDLIWKALYFLVIVGPFFSTHIRPLWTFGALVSITGIITYSIWNVFLISVWCFFGALVSMFVLYILHKKVIPDIA